MLSNVSPGFHSRYENHFREINKVVQQNALENQSLDWMWERLNTAGNLREELNSLKTLHFGSADVPYSTIEALRRLNTGETVLRGLIKQRTPQIAMQAKVADIT